MIIHLPCGGTLNLADISRDPNVPILCSNGCAHSPEEVALIGAQILRRSTKAVWALTGAAVLIGVSITGVCLNLPPHATIVLLQRAWTIWELGIIIGCILALGFLPATRLQN